MLHVIVFSLKIFQNVRVIFFLLLNFLEDMPFAKYKQKSIILIKLVMVIQQKLRKTLFGANNKAFMQIAKFVQKYNGTYPGTKGVN